jgi:hypothetical protein
MNLGRHVIFLCLVLLLTPALAVGQEAKTPSALPSVPSDPSREIKAPAIQMIAPGVFEIGGVRLSKREGRVEFEALVNMEKGLLEYLIVGETGKVHESLLRTKIEPFSLQIALLLIGLEGTTNPLVEQGDPRTPEGDPVTIWLKWIDRGKIIELPIEEWVATDENGTPAKPMDWVFTGSVVMSGIFMAQVEKSIVAIYHDPVAMIDHQSPEGASDENWFVNEKVTPPAGTEVTVTIKKGKKASRP